MKLPALILTVAFLASRAFAADSHKVEVIKEVLAASDLPGTLEKMRLDNVAQTRAAMLQQAGDKPINPMMMRLINRAMEKYADYSKELFGYSRWEKEYLAFYDEAYTEPELDGLLAFYKTDAGRATLRAQPLLARKMQESAFQRSAETNERINQIMAETIAEVQAELKKEGTLPP